MDSRLTDWITATARDRLDGQDIARLWSIAAALDRLDTREAELAAYGGAVTDQHRRAKLAPPVRNRIEAIEDQVAGIRRLLERLTAPVASTALDDIDLIVNTDTPRSYAQKSRTGLRYADDPMPQPREDLYGPPAAGNYRPEWRIDQAEELAAWWLARPGRGVGGGRPRNPDTKTPRTIAPEGAS